MLLLWRMDIHTGKGAVTFAFRPTSLMLPLVSCFVLCISDFLRNIRDLGLVALAWGPELELGLLNAVWGQRTKAPPWCVGRYGGHHGVCLVRFGWGTLPLRCLIGVGVAACYVCLSVCLSVCFRSRVVVGV